MKERLKELNNSQNPEFENMCLTKEEIEAGWHFCPDWDYLAITPDCPEWEDCGCSI